MKRFSVIYTSLCQLKWPTCNALWLLCLHFSVEISFFKQQLEINLTTSKGGELNSSAQVENYKQAIYLQGAACVPRGGNHSWLEGGERLTGFQLHNSLFALCHTMHHRTGKKWCLPVSGVPTTLAPGLETRARALLTLTSVGFPYG